MVKLRAKVVMRGPFRTTDLAQQKSEIKVPMKALIERYMRVVEFGH